MKRPVIGILSTTLVIVAALLTAVIIGGANSATNRASAAAGQPPAPRECVLEAGRENPKGVCLPGPADASAPEQPTGQTIPAGALADTSNLPDCINVNAGPTIVGCAFKHDLYAEPSAIDQMQQLHPFGTPIYDLETKSRIVGYLTETIGFVPNELLPQLDALKACNEILSAEIQTKTSGQLSADCRQLLAAQGIDARLLEGK